MSMHVKFDNNGLPTCCIFDQMCVFASSVQHRVRHGPANRQNHLLYETL